MNKCTCGADLTEDRSVAREYVNKETGGLSVYSLGHYIGAGDFESDSFDGFGDGRYDLLDASDTCVLCEVVLQ